MSVMNYVSSEVKSSLQNIVRLEREVSISQQQDLA